MMFDLFLAFSFQGWLTLIVILAVFMMSIFTKISSDFIFLAGLGFLLITNVLSVEDTLKGFSSSGLVTVAVLYIVVSGLQETGALFWISKSFLGFPGTVRKAQLRLMLPVSFMSAFLNNTPVVALFIPIVIEWSKRIQIKPSKLLIPLSYASILGGVCTLIGTSTNLIINNLLQQEYPTMGLNIFEISKIGIICVVIGILYILLFSKFLPDRHAFFDMIKNPREYTSEMIVLPGDVLDGQTIESAGLRHLPGAFLAELVRTNEVISAVSPNYLLKGNDRLVFVGKVDSMKMLIEQPGLRPASEQIFKLDSPRHQRCLVEAVVSNTCPLVGKTIREGRFRDHYNAVVVAIARNGERLNQKIGDVVLQPGDTLLVESHAGFIPRQKDSRDFYLVSQVDQTSFKQFKKKTISLTILCAMVLLAAFGVFSMLKASILAAGFMLLFKCCSPTQARRNIEWNVLLTIGAALGLGLALDQSGAAKTIATGLLSLSGCHPWVTLVLIYFITTFFTEIITNNAAAALIFPIAINSARTLDVSIMPFVICIMIAASASFATPIGYQTNLMIYGPGGYHFSDYLKIGIPLNFLVGLIVCILAPIIWPF